ncbi:diguanylate cyclase, partial [Vibrio parahaemolyticus]
SSNEVVGILGISTDITKQKELEKKAHQQARMDELTQLLNRRGLIESVQQAWTDRKCTTRPKEEDK